MGIRFNLPTIMQQAIPVLEKLGEQGYEAVFVGGCVRDTVMGLSIKDVDIATSARPEQVLSLFPRCIPTGLQHGTVTVLHDGIPYEVTTYRTESEYEKHRRPAQVEFIDRLDGDLLRRDLTINAMAMYADGELYDPFQGIEDLRHMVIRCVGDADARFQEDALRMLRTIRFASQFGFSIAHQTWRALIKHRELLQFIAMERVSAELDRMMSGAAPQHALHLLSVSRLLLYCGTPLAAADKLGEAYLTNPDGFKPFTHIHELQPSDMRYAALLMVDYLTTIEAEETLKALRLPTARVNSIMAVLHMHSELIMRQDEDLRLTWTNAVIQYGETAARGWLSIAQWDPHHVLHPHANLFMEWLDNMPAITLKQLKLNGKQLAGGLNQEPGTWMGRMLQQLLLQVALGKLPNEQEALLAQAQIWNIED
jgi:tRNA nucleotidyltransferase (CCA-adding enzyme)